MTTLARSLPAPYRRPRLSVLAMLDVWRQRRALARLDARMLADIGVTEAEALKEAARPIWDLPA